MPTTNLEQYIKENQEKGYDINTIRWVLIRWGYNPNDIDPILTQLNPPKLPEAKQETRTQKETNLDATRKENTNQKENNFINLIIRPNSFFQDTKNYNTKKALRHILHLIPIFLIINLITSFLAEIMGKNKPAPVLATLLANLLSSAFFLLSIIIFCVFLLTAYYLTFRYILKTPLDFKLLLAILSFSITPYILINSLNNLKIYSTISLAGISLGFLNINMFFLWFLLLFSLGSSNNLNLEFKKAVVFVIVPFLVVMAPIIILFHSAIKANFLWFFFEQF